MRTFRSTHELMIGRAPTLHYVQHGRRQAGQHLLIRVDGRLRIDHGNVEPVIAAFLVQHRYRLRYIVDPV